MALNLGAIDEFFDASMVFTIGTKEYRAPAISGELGLWVRTVAVRQGELGENATAEEQVAAREECGPAPIPEGYTEAEAFLSKELVAQLLADGVQQELIQHLTMTAFIRAVSGDGLAMLYARGEDPKALAGNRTQRRALAKAIKRAPVKTVAAKKASDSKTTSTAAATTTRAPASGNATKSQATSARPAKAVKASRGAKS